MISRNILIIAFFLIINRNVFAGFGNHIAQVTKNCEKISSLLVKKSLLELKHSGTCSEHFTKLLLSECEFLTCNEIIESYKKNILSNSRAVVGE